MRRILGKDRLRADTAWMMAGRKVRDVFVQKPLFIDCIYAGGWINKSHVYDAGIKVK